MKKKIKNEKDLEYYLNLSWTYTIKQEKSGNSCYYVIYVNELPGICTDSENLDKGMKEIKELIANVIEIYKEKGEIIPEPVERDSYKGKISYRTDSERHYLIAQTAHLMDKSISKTLDTLVDKGLKNLRII